MDFLFSISEKLKSTLQKAGLESPQQIICTSDAVLLRHGVSQENITLLKNIAAKHLSFGFRNVSDIITNESTKWSRIGFGCRTLDACTGGILTRGLTEICGESGAGKTQLVLQLSIMVQLPKQYGGLEKSAVFISTEDCFPSKRLFQIAENFCKTYPNFNFLQNIFVEQIMDSENLLKCVTKRLPTFMEQHSIGLVVIDSIAAVYRIESNILARANEMRKLVNTLLALSDKYTCAVICINQVASVTDESNTQVPCLGLAWASLVRTRIKVSKIGKNASCKGNNLVFPVRKVDVIYSPIMANNTCEFLITTAGAVDLHETLN